MFWKIRPGSIGESDDIKLFPAIDKKAFFKMKSAMVVKLLLIIMVRLSLVIVAGCSEKETPQSKAARVSKEVYSATKAYTQEQMLA